MSTVIKIQEGVIVQYSSAHIIHKTGLPQRIPKSVKQFFSPHYSSLSSFKPIQFH